MIEKHENKILCRDAIRFTESLPAEVFDLVVCDGPYGVTNHD